MAPTKPRAVQDDSRSEASSTKEKAGHSGPTTTKARRGGANAASSSLRDVTNASATAVGASGNTAGASQEPAGIHWSSLDHETLQSYRHAYGLKTPSAFKSEYNHLILSQPGIGRFSPTIARQKNTRRQSKDQLANAVRKHFNGMGIQENEAVVDFLYKVKYQDKNFRMRFTPQGPR